LAEDKTATSITHMTRRTYVIARVVVLIATIVALLAAITSPERYEISYLIVGLLLLTASTVGVLIAFRMRQVDLTTVITWTTPGDLIALWLLVVALHGFEDAVYPVFIIGPIFYTLVVRRREAMVITAATAFVYVLAHTHMHQGFDFDSMLFLIMKTVSILLVGIVALLWAERLARREEVVEVAKSDREELNDQLHQRLAELQAVSQITEIIHSTLDFDRVGPLTLEILTKVLGIDSCALFVIDRKKSKTLFTASVGAGGATVPVRSADLDLLEEGRLADGHFSCISILDHHQMMVVFCSEADAIEAMGEEDRLMLQAVANELIVAVENSQLYKLTRTLAITDELTGLHNYRFFQQRLDEEIERARRYHKDLSMLMIDIDDFKGFNDSQGHIAGDAALAEFARVLEVSTREVDVVARYGGEEFSIILPETDAAGAFVVGEKVREAVAKHEFKDADGDPSKHLTVSVGLATFPTHAEEKETLLRQADDALYEAKHGGRNRVRSPVLQRAVRETRSTEPDGEES